MKRYNVLQAFIMAFYSKALYKDVGQNWRGTGFAYLLLLLAVCWLVILFHFSYFTHQFISQNKSSIAAKVPVIHVVNGNVSMDQNIPYVLTDNTNEPVIVIDTQMAADQVVNQPGQVFILQNQVIIRKDDGQLDAYNIPAKANFTFGPTQAHHFMSFLDQWLAAIAFPFLVIFSWIYRVFQGIIYAALGSLIISRMVNVKLEYQTVLRLTMIAVTPAIILSTLFWVFNFTFPFVYLFYFILTMFYLGMGLKANREQAQLKEITHA